MKELVVITGSGGRIGRQIAKHLSQRYTIVGFELSQPNGLSKEETLHVDISSEASVRAAFEHISKCHGTRIASVIHLAAYYSFSEKHSPLYDTITVQGTERLLKYLQNFEVEQFLFSSTMLVHAPQRPGHPITENSPLVAKWDYPLSKIRTEQSIHHLRKSIPSVILRIAGVYDDDCHSIPISHQIQRIYEHKLESHFFPGNLQHGSTFIHMDDLVDAITLAIDKRKELPDETVLLLGESETLSYRYLQRTIASLLGKPHFKTFRIPKWFAKVGAWIQRLICREKPFIRPWMIAMADDHYELNIDRAKKILGWTPKHSLRKKLPTMIHKLQENPKQWYEINQLSR